MAKKGTSVNVEFFHVQMVFRLISLSVNLRGIDLGGRGILSSRNQGLICCSDTRAQKKRRSVVAALPGR